ncbi:MAG: alpha/beta fold hydrolase [Syntrophobacteraceae bacterium]
MFDATVQLKDFAHRYFGMLAESCKVPAAPEFATPHRVIRESSAYRLLEFASDPYSVPTLILPPQAGHHSAICDLSRENSLVGTLLDNGVKSLHVVDWKPATHERANESLDDLISQTDQCISAIGRPVNLIGLCQGGWQAAIYAALFPDNMKTLTAAGSPIDAHAGGGKIQEALKFTPLSFFEALVDANGGTYPGQMQLLGFKLLNPLERFWGDYLKLFSAYGDFGFVARNHLFSNWYEYVQDLPGRWFMQIVEGLFYKNGLCKNKLTVLGRQVNLSKIACPVIMIGGTKDDITLPEQVFALGGCVSTAVRFQHRFEVDSGHIGLFMGSKALREVWPDVARLLVEYHGTSDAQAEMMWF